MYEVRSRAELRAQGMTSRDLTIAVRTGILVRPRRDHYVPADYPADIIRALRVGGRLTCLSLLALLGVFVYRVDRLHVHVPTTGGRLAQPSNRKRRLQRRRRAARVHWLPLGIDPGPAACVDVVDALAHAVRCLPPRMAVATLDSALHLGVVTAHRLTEMFAMLPSRYAVLSGLVDGRAESGTETIVRLMVRGLGAAVELQVEFDGVGRVDLLVDGWLVIECDSREFHGTWEDREEDLRRDAVLASRGYSTLRLTAQVILYNPEFAIAAIRGLLSTRAASPAPR